MKFSRMRSCAALMAILTAPAYGASLDLSPEWPDLTLFNAQMNYVYTPLCSGAGEAVPCTGAAVPDPSLSHGELNIQGSLLALNPDGNSLHGVTDGYYELHAQFDGYGNFVTGRLTIGGTVETLGYDSGLLVDAALTRFGFQGQDASGVLEWEFGSNDGDLLGVSGSGVVIASVFGLSSSLPQAGAWDSAGDNNPEFWRQDLQGQAQADTSSLSSVPLPAAMVLFPVGLTGVALAAGGVMRRWSMGSANGEGAES